MEEIRTSLGYVAVIGPKGPKRMWTETTLLQGGHVVTCVETIDGLDTGALDPPNLIVIVDSPARWRAPVGGRIVPGHPASSVPCIIVSDDDSVESYGSAIARGAAAHLTYPVGAMELLEAARRLSVRSTSSPGSEKRLRVRRCLLIAIKVDVRATGRCMDGWMLDASGGGCRIELPETIPPGTSVRIMLYAGARATQIALSAEVRWSQRTESSRRLLGVRFVGTSALLAAKMLGTVPSGQT
ncbi:MAG: PilZ domain-containing protein [Vicinamibacteria bacterium]|nr:PilZ domain-containing protein [Vicinamibacteria bacterium]